MKAILNISSQQTMMFYLQRNHKLLFELLITSHFHALYILPTPCHLQHIMAFSHRSSLWARAEASVSSLIANVEMPRKVFSLHSMSIWYPSDYIVCTISSSRPFVGYTAIRTGSEGEVLFRKGHGVSSSLNACKRSAYP